MSNHGKSKQLSEHVFSFHFQVFFFVVFLFCFLNFLSFHLLMHSLTQTRKLASLNLIQQANAAVFVLMVLLLLLFWFGFDQAIFLEYIFNIFEIIWSFQF